MVFPRVFPRPPRLGLRLGSSHDFFLIWIVKNHVYSVEQTDLVLPCSKTYRLDEKFVDTAFESPLRQQIENGTAASWRYGSAECVFCLLSNISASR